MCRNGVGPINPNLSTIRPEMLRVRPDLSKAVESFVDDRPMGVIAYEALVKFHGGVKQAAYALGNVDLSVMKREIEGGKFERLQKDPDSLSVVLEALSRVYVRMTDPKTRVRQEITRARQALNEIEQGLEAMTA